MEVDKNLCGVRGEESASIYTLTLSLAFEMTADRPWGASIRIVIIT
jgi:hypothetical protein